MRALGIRVDVANFVAALFAFANYSCDFTEDSIAFSVFAFLLSLFAVEYFGADDVFGLAVRRCC